MKTKKVGISEITEGAAKVLREDLVRTEGTIKHYQVHWRKIERFMESSGIPYFNSGVGKNFLLTRFGERDYSSFSKSEKDLLGTVNVLIEFYETGNILSKKEQVFFEGDTGRLMKAYLSHAASQRLKASTLYEKSRHLYRFQKYMETSAIPSLRAVTSIHILTFLMNVNRRFSTLQHHTIQTLRGFFSYLYKEELIAVDLASHIPKDKFCKQPKLPSVYTEKEISDMLGSIDRSTKKGRRNFAIVLLAARLGLRSSDIGGLRFTDIDWDNCVISLNQFKTGKMLELPLFPEIGEAIIDYLKYGRPKSTLQQVFLLARSPFTAIVSNAIGGIVRSSYLSAGIDISNRKAGTHTLRHSLAGILLAKGTTLPVITEVLGHENSASTRYYLRIDLASMRTCALEVPQVSETFYNQKGGYFYV